MENTLNQLDQLFARIAEALGLALETVQENGMEYILMYGKYQATTSALTTFWWVLISSMILVSIVAIPFALAYLDNYEPPLSKPKMSNFNGENWRDEYKAAVCVYKKEENKEEKRIFVYAIKTILTIAFSITLLAVLASLIPYWISPEVYSIKEALELIR